MTEAMNFINNPDLEKFSSSIISAFISALTAITSKPVALSLDKVTRCDGPALFEPYANEILILGKEEKGSYEAGLFFKTKDITKLADFMLAGDGESKDSIDDDLKDAIKELTLQMLSSTNTPLEDIFGNKFSFKSHNVSKNTSSNIFKCMDYYVIDIKGDINGDELKFRFFIDAGIEIKFGDTSGNNLIDDDSINALLGDAGIFFDDKQDDNIDGDTPKNLELLLDVDMPVSVKMGSAKLFLKDILGLGPGNIVELEQNADEPIELLINDKVIARGEVVVVDGYFGFRIKEIVSKAERIRKLKDWHIVNNI